MSEHSDIISFDLQEGKGSILDISSLFPFASVHAIRSTKPILDTLRIGAGRVYDFSLSYRLSLKRFRTLETLDLSTPELWQPNILSTRILKIRPRFSTIDLVPPLDIPFESLDLRNEVPVPSVKRYPDLFRRDLPISLHMRREWKHIRRAVWIRKKSILSTLLLCILLTLPSLWYTKVLVEDGYAKLSNIRVLTDREVILSSIQDSKRDFERSNILFALFRFIPNDQIRLVRMAIDGGLALTRGIDTLVARLPDAPLTVSGSQVLTDTSSDTVAPDYRGKARDIALLAPLGIDLPTDWLEKNQDAIISFQVALQDAAKAFAQAQSITDPRRDELMHYSRTFLELSRIIAFYTDHEKDLLTMLGHTEPERYIVFNQNRDEIRANGGFPGSVITFTLYKGNILDYRTDDIYYFDWNLYPYKETPPPGLALLTDSYGLRDVNYYPDFHETLEKANAFVERSGDATLTTGIALHQ